VGRAWVGGGGVGGRGGAGGGGGGAGQGSLPGGESPPPHRLNAGEDHLQNVLVRPLDDFARGTGEGEPAGDGNQTLVDERRQGRLSLGELVQGLTTALDGHFVAGADNVFRINEHAVGFHM